MPAEKMVQRVFKVGNNSAAKMHIVWKVRGDFWASSGRMFKVRVCGRAIRTSCSLKTVRVVSGKGYLWWSPYGKW